jgi:uncharacterized protein HemX
MNFELNESELKRNLDWLKKEDGALNDYATVIKYLLNEIEKLKQSQETRPHETIVISDLEEAISKKKEKIETLKLSGNPNDWIMGDAEKLVLHGMIQARQILKK